MNLKSIPLLLLHAIFILLIAACGGGSQKVDTPTPETKAAKVQVEPSSTKGVPKTEPTKPTASTGLPPTVTPIHTPVPAIVGTVNFQVDVQTVTTASQIGMASVVGPSLIRLKDGRYRLYLQARANKGGKNVDGMNIISLISTDGAQWDLEPGVRISHGGESDLDFQVGEPAVYLGLDGKYHMAYTGRHKGVNKKGESQLMHRVGFAISDNGLTWTKLNKHYADPDNINDFVSSADVTVIDVEYVIYYTGQRNIIRATSQDGHTWVRQEIAISAGHDSTMVKYDGAYYMFAKMPEALAYARNAVPKLDFLVMAISHDGVNWSNNYYQVVVENADGSEVNPENLQDPSAILLEDGSLRIFLNNDRGEGILSIKPVAKLPKVAESRSQSVSKLESGARAKRPTGPTKQRSVETDITFCTVEDTSLRLDLHHPSVSDGSNPAVVFLHEGSWIAGDKQDATRGPVLAELTSRGYLVAAVNYRLAPEFKFPAHIQDAKCAVRYLRANAERLGIDSKRIGAWGRSAGGHLAMLLGLADENAGWDQSGQHLEQSSRVQAVVDMYGPIIVMDGICSKPKVITEVFGTPECDPEVLVLADPLTHISSEDPPFLILHSDGDPIVPSSYSQTFYKHLTEAGVPATLAIVDHDKHHFNPDMMDPSHEEVAKTVADFLDEALR